VLEHEINAVLGLGSSLDGSTGVALDSTIFPEDLFRYASAGTRSFQNCPAGRPGAYFSINSGTTNLANFDNDCNGGDAGDWGGGGPTRVQDAFGTPGATPTLGIELTALDVIGYDLVVPEPGSMILVLSGLGLLVFVRRRAQA
jgi:hypothetical protein